MQHSTLNLSKASPVFRVCNITVKYIKDVIAKEVSLPVSKFPRNRSTLSKAPIEEAKCSCKEV